MPFVSLARRIRPALLRVPGLLWMVLCVAAPASADEFEYPAGRTGQVAQAFFESFAAGDVAMRTFLLEFRDRASLERVSIEDRIEQFHHMQGLMGTPVPHSILESSDGSVSILARSDSGDGWFQFDFQVETSVPFKLTSMRIRPAANPEAAEVTEWTDLGDLLRQTCELQGIPGMAAAVIADGKILESAVAGIRAAGTDDAVRPGDRFHIGSVTKSMTGTLVASLIEDGKLRWNSTVGEVLPDLPVREEYRNVTVSQLLRHRGGIAPVLTVTDEEEQRHSARPGTATERRAAFLQEILSQPPVNTPGTTFEYSNAGFTLLGLMAETASGWSWESMLQERLFTPLEMATSGVGWPATQDRPDQPRGHFGTPPELRVQEFGEYAVGDYIAPAGDVHCSVEDLAKYAGFHLRALNGEDSILEAATVIRLHDPGEVEEGEAYGGGWVITELAGEPLHWHNGSAGTFFSLVWLLPQTQRGGVVLMNSGALSNQSIAESVLTKALEGR